MRARTSTPLWLLVLALLMLAPPTGRAGVPARVYAASSLTGVLTDLAAAWQRAGHAAPVLVFAGSATLARQLAAGARADVFVSADAAWMDHVQAGGGLDDASRVDLLTNSLVLVAPRGAAFPFEMRRGVPLATAFRGRLCTGEPGVVPVGTYAREALQALGAWDALRDRLVGTEDVRAALAFVERGHCNAGIVYGSDARSSARVEVVGVFPAASHRPIVYPAALMRGARPEGRAFFEYLRDAREAGELFERHGFGRLARAQ